MNIKIILILLLSITCSAINARKITIYNKSQKTLEVIIIPAEVRHPRQSRGLDEFYRLKDGLCWGCLFSRVSV